MLVAQRDLEMQHGFTRALETEVAGLDDPGVDRADGNLMNLRPLNPIEIANCRSKAMVQPNRFEPRMPGGHEPVLLPDFAFEEVSLNGSGCERRVAAGDRRALCHRQ